MVRRPVRLLLLVTMITSISFSGNAYAQNSKTEDSLLQLAEERFYEMKETEALNLYLEALEKDHDNYTALWNTSLLFARDGYRQDKEEKALERYKRALYYAQKAVLSYPDSGHSHYVFSVANGRLADISSKKERIRKSHLIKKHIDKAVLIDSTYAPAWHLYGVWHSSVANISKAEKIAANVVSEGLPRGASNEKAEKYLKKAIKLDPDKILFRLDLAKHFLNSGNKEEAKQELIKLLDLKPQIKGDCEYLKNAQRLLGEIQSS